MRKTKRSLPILLMAIALLAAACGDSDDDSNSGPTAEDSTTTAATVAPEPADEPADEPEAPAAPGEELIAGYADWDAVLAEADGQTVNFYLWGGSDKINADVDNDIGAQVSELFGVTLNRVPLGDTADAVNLVLNEIEAGQTTGGSVDMIWINGENFRTLKDADALLAAWSEALPNAVFVNWDDPSVANDFGEPVEGTESPWGHAQFVFEFNTELVGDVAPDSFEDLQAWIHENPGLFTYPAVPDFTGSVFLRHLFYWAAGGSEAFAGPFDQEVFDQYAPTVWEYLNDIGPSLWRGGDTYPTEAAVQQDLLANQEVAFSMSYNPSNATTQIIDGVYPDTIRTFIPVTGSISNNNYVTIPSNAGNAAGALVVANYMLSEEYQLKMTDPNGWGWLTATDPNRWSDEAQATLAGYEAGVATLPQTILNANALPEPSADWVEAMEQGWLDNVL